MKKRTKSKTLKSSTKGSRAAKSDLPELVAVMMKIAERLDALEKKMDLVISQTSVLLSQTKPVSQNFQRQEPSHYAQSPQPTHHAPQQNHGQNARVLHKAVCADCHEDCEVPFKPSGERPIYCKECFAKRKATRSSKTNHERTQVPEQRRLVKVIPHGVGKVTISEIVNRPQSSGSHRNFNSSAKAGAVPSARHSSSERKGHKPSNRSRRS